MCKCPGGHLLKNRLRVSSRRSEIPPVAVGRHKSFEAYFFGQQAGIDVNDVAITAVRNEIQQPGIEDVDSGKGEAFIPLFWWVVLGRFFSARTNILASSVTVLKSGSSVKTRVIRWG